MNTEKLLKEFEFYLKTNNDSKEFQFKNFPSKKLAYEAVENQFSIYTSDPSLINKLNELRETATCLDLKDKTDALDKVKPKKLKVKP